MILRSVRAAALGVMTPCLAWAQGTPDQLAALETVTVIGTTPLPGTGIDIDKLPSNSQSLTSADLTRDGSASVIQALGAKLGSISINDNLDDPFQPDILYRGFEASPVLGTPQGLAVYQNGVRINEAFGDAVNWDLFPDIAISRLDVVSANPVYGLNALGGAVVVSMKNGFSDPGGEAELTGGSFGRRGLSVQYGVNDGEYGAYIAARALDEDGWRVNSPNAIRQLYTDLTGRFDRLTLDLSFTGANNRLFGESATPVQELAVSRALIFTTPQYNFDQLEFATLNGSYQASETLSLQASFYYREFRQDVLNGNTTNYAPCTGAGEAGLLCQPDGLTPLTDPAGRSIPDLTAGGTRPIGENDFEWIRAVGLGGSLQASETADLLGHDNQLTAGASLDHAGVDFQSSAELGVIGPGLYVEHSGLFVDTPESSPFSATPVRLNAINRYYGLYATDTFNLNPDLAITASGRYNIAQIDLADHLGTALGGQNRYGRLNPALGFSDRLLPELTVYGGYAEANRAPTASEIECSNPLRPCLLPSSLASDPPSLRQVVAHSWETGLRGTLDLGDEDRLGWSIALFRTDLADDIYGIATSLSTGFFQNIGATRRQGLELGASYKAGPFSAYANYSYVAATFQSPLTLSSPSNPHADAGGLIHVRPGDQLPGIPEHRLKAGADWHVTDDWTVGATLTVVGPQYYRGDEANLNGELPAYAVLGLHTTYELTERVELFASLENALDAQYATFGVYGDPTGVGAPGIPADATTNGPGVDNRFQSPAAPIAAFGGVRLRF